MSLFLSKSGGQAGFTSPDLPVGQYDELYVDLNFTGFTGGTSPTIQVVTKRKQPDGIYYQIDAPTALSAAGVFSRSLGKGSAQQVSFGDVVQVTVVVTGAPTAAPWTLSVGGK